MTAKQLAEMMISGDLGYKPENDAHWIATKYLELEAVTKKLILSRSLINRLEANSIMSEDPALIATGRQKPRNT